MERTRLVGSLLCCTSLLCCLFSFYAAANNFNWTPASHLVLKADLNRDGIDDLLVQGKTAGAKHYLVLGQSSLEQLYDYQNSSELPQKIDDLQWSADLVQLLPIKVSDRTGQSLLEATQQATHFFSCEHTTGHPFFKLNTTQQATHFFSCEHTTGHPFFKLNTTRTHNRPPIFQVEHNNVNTPPLPEMWCSIKKLFNIKVNS